MDADEANEPSDKTILRITRENDALQKAFMDAFKAADDAKKNLKDDGVKRQTAHEMAVAFEAWWDKSCSFTALTADPAEVYGMLVSQKGLPDVSRLLESEPPIPPLDNEDVLILRYLAEQGICKVQADIEQATRISRKTVGKRLLGLRNLGLIEHPPSKDGDMITPAGRSILRRLPVA